MDEPKNMKEEKKVEENKIDENIVFKEGLDKSTSKMRQIIIETDGNDIKIIKAEVGGKIEFIGILQNLIEFFRRPPQQ